MSKFEVRFYREYIVDAYSPDEALSDARKMFKESMKAENKKFEYEIIFEVEPHNPGERLLKKSFVSGETMIER